MKIDGDSKLISAAFVKARAEMSATVSKDGTGNYGKYATLAALVEVTSAALGKNGLAVVQEASTDDVGVVVETWLVHESGAMMQFTPLVMPMVDRKPQSIGSAITYGRRYALAAVFGIAPDDDDGQAAQDAENRAKAQNHTRPTTKAPQSAPTPAQSDDAVFTKPEKPRATAAQLKELNALGLEFYGDEWNADDDAEEGSGQASKLAAAVSKGATSDPAELLQVEIAKLIAGIRTKMAQVSNGVAG